ncbi:MAG TPA: mobile mystery protein A [Chitinophagaceae bacterium]
MTKTSLQLQQLNSKMQAFASPQRVTVPPTGWIKAIRLALGMSLEQLARKLSITKQGALALERREKDASITISTLLQVADALDMHLVYGFIPKDGSLNALINRRAEELAKEIVMRTSNTMKLEDQENSSERIKKAIKERAMEIKNEMPKTLWD